MTRKCFVIGYLTDISKVEYAYVTCYESDLEGSDLMSYVYTSEIAKLHPKLKEGFRITRVAQVP